MKSIKASSLFSVGRREKLTIALGLDLLLIVNSYIIALVLVGDMKWPEIFSLDIKFVFINIIVSLLILGSLGVYKNVHRFINFKILYVLVFASLLITCFLYIINFFLKGSFNLATSIVFFALLCISLCGVRIFIRSYYVSTMSAKRLPVIIYGAGAAGQQLALSLINGNEYCPVAFIDDNKSLQNSLIQGIKVYSASDLKKLSEYLEPKKILLALPSLSKNRRQEIISNVESIGISIQTIPGVSDIVDGKMKVDEFQDVEIDDLLGRASVTPNKNLLEDNIAKKTVMVTGAGGSIGSELCRQIIRLKPKKLLLFEISEFALYAIDKELNGIIYRENLGITVLPFLGTVQNQNRIKTILSTYNVDTLYHAAAYKHVPMVEYNVVEGVRNNIFGTLSTAKAAVEAKVETFVLVSTDKAVRPTNVMGATKRMAELVLQALAKANSETRFCMVRFGNVLGSSGSVVPLFKKQIKAGGPVTVTHPDIIRYFMTIPEAAQLVIQAGSMGIGGDVFVLDMGEPVKIGDLAKRIIALMGLELMDESNPNGDIELIYTGLRPGEKLYEELLIGEDVAGTEHPRIMTANEIYLDWAEMKAILDCLDNACRLFDQTTIRNILLNAPTGFDPSDGICDLVWNERQKNNVVPLSSHKREA